MCSTRNIGAAPPVAGVEGPANFGPADFRPLTASVQDALRLLSEDPMRFDLVITDQTMPGITGTALVRALRAEHVNLPVILCTGFGPGVSADAMAELGIHSVLEKPMSRQKLAEAVARALDSQAPGAERFTDETFATPAA